MQKFTSFVWTFLLVLGGASFSQQTASVEEAERAFTKRLPSETQIRSSAERRQIPASANVDAWEKFTAQTGAWIVEWNPLTGNPHRAYGGQYRIAGVLAKNAAGVEVAAQRFLSEQATMLKLDVTQLQLRRVDKIDNKWYVSYQQMKDHLPVLFSEVELRLSENGNVMMFGADFHPNVQVNTTPALAAANALEMASRGMEVLELITESESSTLAILPIPNEDHLDYRLVYRFELVTINPAGRWVSYVDAHSGEILWRFNRVRHSVGGNVRGAIHRNNATDALTNHPLPDLFVNIGGQRVSTNAAGDFNLATVGTSFSFTAKLEGKYARVTQANGAAASFTATVQDGQTQNILWEESNSLAAERDAYFHTNIAHTFIKSVDPTFTGVDYIMPVKVNINQTCNAFWDGRGINFYSAGGGCRNTAEIPTVVYHEYGHGINDMQYVGAGVPGGLTNGALHEGLADINAALLVDDPVVGRGFSENGSGLRNVANTNRYPQNAVGEVHNDGLILAGALWDLRQALGLEKARRYTHFARYGTPDDPDLLTACNEFFIEVLIQDDNDGNLANLTPNFGAINQAFSAHGIGAGSLLRLAHSERADAAASAPDYLVQAQISTAAFIGVNPNAGRVHYATDSRNFQTVPLALVTGNTFQGRIPRQPAGTIVTYYFMAQDQMGASISLPSEAPQSKVFSFIVGFRSRVLHNLETEPGWKVGEANDNATSGIWERVDPNGTTVGSAEVQPEDDNTPGAGQICFVTGNAPPDSPAGQNDVDGGKTTLYSPVFDLTSYQNPLIRYYRWFSNNAGASPGQDFWEVHLSNDSGKTWIEVERTDETDNSWRKVFFAVKTLLPLTKKMQLRFVAQDQNPGSLIEAAVDDFEILDIDGTTAVATLPATLPTELRLHGNYPNPFRISQATGTAIHYELPKASLTRVAIYDLNGRVVRVLQDGLQNAGVHTIVWNGTNAGGSFVSSGYYFAVLDAASRRLSRKILVVR